MKTNRRQFISTAAAAGLAASLPLASCKRIDSDYEKLDLILKQPVFKKELFTSPVIIASIELLRYGNNFICFGCGFCFSCAFRYNYCMGYA